ncbi:secondary thiamine-phosphate synthase enzyme YjbQ [Methanofollis fontis]|uniref:Secondary thiamine-phosphate synthase enzyme n=1 Tax=Methanofollis fontis TaxID=2052832 RepID=A0A483CP41_9EURY|nr:secondary thiamine-phosphate synthase enzyme YjbQ [Methanofollis fontis]TAJ44475.1 secondary thiamine-phosphate synthase enzyme [Methanofollis fontis]
MVYQSEISLTTRGEGDIVDITAEVRRHVAESAVTTGICHLFVIGSTAALTTIEYEDGVLQDLRDAFEAIAPSGIPYAHDRRWGDGNGRSHVRASIVGPSLTIPVRDGAAVLGTWQQVVLLELDIRQRRERTVVCTVLS